MNAGHPSPILIREGHAETVALAPGLPFGVALHYNHHVQELQLEEGDRLVFVTDGILERNAAEVNAMEVLTQTHIFTHARQCRR